jgi:hypothetical protein
MVARINGRKVWCVDGVCRYLSKYVSKGGLELAILAILYRRRLWACTLKNIVKSESKWIPDASVSSYDAREQCTKRNEWAASFGWNVEMGADEEYAVWSKRLELIAPRSGDEVGWGPVIGEAERRYGQRWRPPMPERNAVIEAVWVACSSELFWRLVNQDWIDRTEKVCYNGQLTVVGN